MPAAVISIQKSSPEEAFTRCKDVIAAGGVIAYPTDTYYALGVDPLNAAAVRRLYAVKGRSAERPILLLLPDAGEVFRWTESISVTAEKLMRQFWPGPLTLVFKAQQDVPAELAAGTGTIGLRVPGNEVTRSLLRFLGAAITGTSANRSGEPDARTAADVNRMLGEHVDLILDGGTMTAEKPSTIVDVSGQRPMLIRRGMIDVSLD